MQQYISALAVLLSVTNLFARQELLSCGTHAEIGREQVQLHRISERTRNFRARKAAVGSVSGERLAAGAAVRADVGNLAILDDADGIVARRNPFDLNGQTLRFFPSGSATQYRYEAVASDTYDIAAAEGGTFLRGLADDDSREAQISFSFPFFGQQYSTLYINSDGNITLGSADSATTDRSLGRFAAGSPRISPLFTDLDPTKSTRGISVQNRADRVVISWVSLPEYRTTGIGPLQTFQVRLYPDGRIEFSYLNVTSQDAVAGLSSGVLLTAPSIVDYGNASGVYTSTVAERFSGSEEVDIYSAAQRFYASHDDAYDYLVLFNDLNVSAAAGAVAYEVTLRNDRSGYGDAQVDSGAEAGSPRRLQAILNMGPLRNYPIDPNAAVPLRSSTGDTPMTILAHEAGHLFLAYASVPDPNGTDQKPMLGYQGAHWAPSFNSEASLLEGERIQDNGPNANPRFLTTATVEGYAPLDQYLMGFRSPAEVPDTFYVANAGAGVPVSLPRTGASFNGERRNVSVADLIAAVGRRTPDHTVAQRRFRFAFGLITATGGEPSAADLQKLETYRQSFEAAYSRFTGGRGTADTALRRAVQVSTSPAAGILTGSTGRGTISVANAVESPLTFTIRSTTGAVSVGPSVTIPAGAKSAAFTFTGARTGNDELVVESQDPSRFETVVSRMAVTDASSALRVAVVSGNGQGARAGVALAQPVRVRVSDTNNLPYSGVSVTAAASTGGAVSPTSAITDENGTASFVWTPGPEVTPQLRISGASIPAAAVATALTKPTIAAGGVVNAASFVAGLTPGGIGTIFGSSLAAAANPTVLLNGDPVTVFYSENRQINFLVPDATPAEAANLVVRNAGGQSDVYQVNVSAVQPGIFFDAPTGYGAVLIAGTAAVTQVRAAQRGEAIEIYCTGLGQNNAAVTVSIGGVAANVLYAGKAPVFPGLYQVNATVPAGVAAGTQPLVLTAGGNRSNEVKIVVR